MAKAFSAWLYPAYGGGVELRPDLDQVEGLSAEREALWARIDKVSFLTLDEKRAAVGYEPAPREEVEPQPGPMRVPGFAEGTAFFADEAKAGFDPNQPRVPAGDSDGGQWTDGGGGGGGSSRSSGGGSSSSRSSGVRVAQANTGGRVGASR